MMIGAGPPVGPSSVMGAPRRRVFQQPARLACLALAVLLGACGGGSSGGGGTQVPTNLVAIDNGNAQGVTGAVVRASNVAYAFGETGSAAVQGVAVSGVTQAFSLAQFAKWQLLMLSGPEGPLSVTGTSNLDANKTPCDQNRGTVSVSGPAVTGIGAPAVGDSYSISFAGCFIGDTQSTLNGSLTMTITSFTGNPLTDTSWSMSAKFKFGNLSSTDAGGMKTFGGGYGFTLTTGDSVTFRGIVQSDSFTETQGQAITGLQKFTVNYSVDTANQAYTLNLHGLYGGTDMNGAVNFDSLAPFSGVGKDWPSSGELKVSGAGGTSATLLTIDHNSVTLSIDNNGDGATDASQSLSWVSLATP